jgi:hypothetical protein
MSKHSFFGELDIRVEYSLLCLRNNLALCCLAQVNSCIGNWIRFLIIRVSRELSQRIIKHLSNNFPLYIVITKVF